MADTTITSANSILTLTVPGVFNSPVQLYGYGVDEAFIADAVDMTEEQMSVDGRMTAGLIFTPKPFKVTLQADSPSNLIFDTIVDEMESIRDVLWIYGTLEVESINRFYTLTKGTLKQPKIVPDGKKVLQAKTFMMVFESIRGAPL